MTEPYSQLTRYEQAIRDAHRMRADAMRDGAATLFGAVRRAFTRK